VRNAIGSTARIIGVGGNLDQARLRWIVGG
jgi:hypothetical protein